MTPEQAEAAGERFGNRLVSAVKGVLLGAGIIFFILLALAIFANE